MRRLACTLAAFAIALPLAGCAEEEPASMPDVVGKRLDVAKSDVERAGFDDEIEVLGGGTFGVVVESNWTVCSQEPASGAAVSSAPRLVVDRECKAAPEPTPSETSPEESADPVLEPTQQEVWVANYNANLKPYIAAVTTAFAMRPKKVDAPAGALNACQLMSKEQPLDKRVGQARKAFTGTSSPTYDEALAAIDATATTICPEFAAFHESQTAERAKQLRAAEKKRKEREQRLKEEAAARAAEEARKLAEQQEPEPESAYYENCTAVEAAGAAPIYAGDPGYGSHLDRDGDGVACEQ